MKKIIFITIFILSFSAFAFGQKSNCPTVSVTAPSYSIQPGETATFTATVSGIETSKIEYLWSIDKGNIVEGQGTSAVTVSTEGLADSTLTATVEIKGFPQGCPNSDSDTTIPYCARSYREVDAVDVLSGELTEERLKAWIAEIENDPSAQAYVIVYNNQKFPPKKFQEKIAYIKKYLFDNIKDTTRLVIHEENKGEDKMNNKFRIFIVPQGAEAPTP